MCALKSLMSQVFNYIDYIGKSVFRHQNVCVCEGGGGGWGALPPKFLFWGSYVPPTPTPPPMKWDIQINQKAT